jgi:hypothetical protein
LFAEVVLMCKHSDLVINAGISPETPNATGDYPIHILVANIGKSSYIEHLLTQHKVESEYKEC